MSEDTDTPICDNAEFINNGVRTGWVRAETARQLERELMEQARLNGMGSEREAALLAKVERMGRDMRWAALLHKDKERIDWMENMNAAELRELFDMVDHKTTVRMAIDKLAARLTSEAAQNDSGALP